MTLSNPPYKEKFKGIWEHHIETLEKEIETAQRRNKQIKTRLRLWFFFVVFDKEFNQSIMDIL